jgi:hypothetical protein
MLATAGLPLRITRAISGPATQRTARDSVADTKPVIASTPAIVAGKQRSTNEPTRANRVCNGPCSLKPMWSVEPCSQWILSRLIRSYRQSFS